MSAADDAGTSHASVIVDETALHPERIDLVHTVYDRNEMLSKSKHLKNFVSTKTSRDTIVQIVDDINLLFENENAGKIMAGTTYTLNKILTDNFGSKSAIRISNGIHDLLNDQNCSYNLQYSIQGIKILMGAKMTADFVNSETMAVTEFMQIPNAPKTAKAIADGLYTIVNQENIDKLIIKSAETLAWLMKTTDYKSMIPGMGMWKGQKVKQN